MDRIVIRGAREHNLKNISLELPRGKFIVITGVSGSGKSTLAFDTIYAEGQRRYVESLSSYARQFLGVMDKPEVESIEGLSPAISIDQKTTSHNPRSTVGTVTEIHDYLRLLFARVGQAFCPECGRPIEKQSASEITDRLLKRPPGTRAILMAPLVRGRKGEYRKLFQQLLKEGYARVRVDGVIYLLEEAQGLSLEKYEKHDIDLVIDRVVLKEEERPRIAKAVELAQVLQEALKARQAQNQGQQNQALPTREATVVADPRTNTLIVTGTQEDLALVEGLIPKLDQPVPQVSLRVRIQEVQSNLTRSLGLKWNSIAGGNVAASILDSGLSLIFDSTRSLAALNIMATLDALQQQGLSRALRDVNQTVLNNQTARLQSGETFFIRRVVNDQVERVPFDVGLIVEVTPQITADGQILLNIKAEISGNVQRNPVDGDVDRFTKQVVTTTLRVKDGETVVLGGLTSQESNQSQQGVPLLMDIPLIGELFKQRTNESTDKELLVVITADILKETASANP